MKPELIIILSIFALFIVAETLFTRLLTKEGSVKGDGWVEFLGTAAITLFTQPKIFLIAYGIGLTVFPHYENTLADIPIWAGFLLFVIFDDMTQYWWHRASHSFPWLYKPVSYTHLTLPTKA